MLNDLPDFAHVTAAAARLAPWIHRTPIMRVKGPGARPLVIKLEGMQRSGSFKMRGALNKLMLLGREARAGVVTASGGNHGLGVTWAGWLLGVPVHVFVPTVTSPWKRDALEAAAAQVRVVGARYPEAEEAARAFAAARDLPYIHAYDDPDVIAGQGTVVAELLEDAPDVGTIVVAVGGGGLAAGAVLAAGGRKVVGVEPYGAPTMQAALRAGHPVKLEDIQSVAADSLGAGQAGERTFAICRRGLDRIELVEDDAIRAAQRWLWEHLRLVYEAGGSAALAAVATGALDGDAGPVGIVLCGANVDPATFSGSMK